MVFVPEVSLTDNEVWDTVSIDIGNGCTVQLGEGDPPGVLSIVVIHDHVLDEGNLTAGGALLLVPSQPETMRVQRGDDIVQAIPVDVKDSDLRSTIGNAAPPAKGMRMVLPWLIATARWWLLPPSIGSHDVQPPITVDVADPDSVSGPGAALGDGMNDPRPGRIGRIRLGVADVSIRHIDQFRFAVAVYVLEQGVFTLHGGKDPVLLPAPALTGWIHIEDRADAKISAYDIGPTIPGEVIGMLIPG